MKFKAKLELGGKTATGLEVPAKVVEALNAGRRPAVSVTLNGRHTYRTTVATMDGRFMLPVSAEVRAAAGVQAGETVEVALAHDTAPRVVEVPADFQAALAKDAAARRAFEALSYSNQRRHVLSIAGAKTDETRQRRLAKALAELKQ